MPNQSEHVPIDIDLIQAREALVTQFHPILSQASTIDRQWYIIRLLMENGTFDFRDLTNQACILRLSLASILTRLEEAGSTVRLKPSNDRCYARPKLTPGGEKPYRSTGALVDERYGTVKKVLSKEKVVQLKELSAKLAKIE